MKMVYLAHGVIPSRKAHSIHIMKMCNAFFKIGVDVELVTTKKSDPALAGENPHEFYDVDHSIRIHKVKWFSNLPGKYYLFGLLAAIKAVLLKPKIVYGRYLFGIYFAECFGKNVVFESHIDEFNRSRLHNFMIKSLVRSKRCLKFVVISRALKETYLEKFPDLEKKIVVAPDGADIQPLQKSKKQNGAFQAGYVGHLYPGKGMEIITELVKICPETCFIIIGGLENDISYWKRQLAEYENLKFLGFLPHHKAVSLMEEMDVLLAPYQSNVHIGSKKGEEIGRWMSPLKIFEYMNARKPIIASNLPVLKEVLTDSQNALLCSPDVVFEWKDAIDRLHEDENLRRKLAQNAFQDLKEKYTWDERAKNILKSLQ